MRVFFVTQDFPPETGGIQTYSFEHTKRLSKEMDYLGVIAPLRKGAVKHDETSGVETIRIRISNALLFLPLIFRLPFLVKKKKVDTVFHAQWQTLVPSIISKKLGLIRNIALASHARELLLNPFKVSFLHSLYFRYMRWALSKVDIHFPVSAYTKSLLLDKKVAEEKIQVVINGTDPQVFFPKDVSDFKKELNLSRSFILLTVTRLVERKGIDTVIKAISILKNEIDSLTYFVIGDGEMKEELKILAREEGVDNNIEFVERTGREALTDYYNACDVFVMPSRTTPPDVEGFGIVYLEANACGKPVIGSYSGGIPSAIIHKKTGLLVEEDNPVKLADAIKSLYDNKEFAEELGASGLQRVRDEANWDAVSKTVIHHLQKLK